MFSAGTLCESEAVFRLVSEKELLDAFRPKDRKLVEIPAGLKLPLLVHDYFAWPHPAGGRLYLVFQVPGGVPTGIAFDVDPGAGGAAVPHLCEWCHQARPGNQVGLLSATVNAKRRAGVHACVDLSCAAKLEEAATLGGYSARPAIEKLLARMGRFSNDALHFDPLGSGR